AHTYLPWPCRRAFLQAVNCGNVRMIQRRERFRLTLKTRQTVRIISAVLGKNLDRDIALQPRVARAIHLAHPAGADGGDDLIGSEAGTGTQGHQLWWTRGFYRETPARPSVNSTSRIRTA